MSDKPRFPRSLALSVFEELAGHLWPACQRLALAGSARRGKPDVGDLELVFIPALISPPSADLFATSADPVPASDAVLAQLLSSGILAQRLSKRGHPAWGPHNKLAVHVASGLPVDLFATSDDPVPATDALLAQLLSSGILAQRLSKRGTPAWGPHNKLAVHVASGLPVDLFATSPEAWHNYLVCRTGPAESNLAIATRAKRRGEQWQPYGPGFLLADGSQLPMPSEQAVFAHVGLPLPPWLVTPAVTCALSL